jgi:periplasmic protein TonB
MPLTSSHSSRTTFIRFSMIGLAALAHVLLLLYFRFSITREAVVAVPEAEVIKLVDFQEYIPPPPPPKPQPKKEVTEVNDQPSVAEKIIQVDEEVVEEEETVSPVVEQEPEYLPQHKISKIPVIPVEEILDRIEYPPMALRQKLEAVVYVELYIDQTGLVRQVIVLKDPKNGFAEAAVKALEGLQCGPAEANGKPVAVRFRYPIRFVLN